MRHYELPAFALNPFAPRPFGGGDDEGGGYETTKKGRRFHDQRPFLALNGGQHFLRQLIGPRAEEEINDVPFVRLQPVESVGWDWADIQAINVCRVRKLIDERHVIGDRCANQCWSG